VKYRPDSFGRLLPFPPFLPPSEHRTLSVAIARVLSRLFFGADHVGLDTCKLPKQRDLRLGDDLLHLSPPFPSSQQPSLTSQSRRNPSCQSVANCFLQQSRFVSRNPLTLDHQRNTLPFQAVPSPNSLEPSPATLGDIFAIPNANLFLLPCDTPVAPVPMAGMARHGSVGAFSGFSVCQPALGAALQWLPAIGTAELDDMINAFLPGPASIQDKRAHISMDFFEYYRQTGENFKFYPVASGSFTPTTASPATSALYDSGYASSFNHSPVLSDQGSWTQSPAPFAPSASDARTSSRSSASKKSSSSSSRQQAVDFASHPGMRILTKDGRDVTNSASRGCKTKEQRDHAHLMRIIKACDACRKKKIRCDPSHRKRNASQASASPSEQKPAKRSRKAEESPPVAIVDAPTDFAAGDALASETLSFPSFDTAYPQGFEEFWTEFVTLDQEPVPVAADPIFNDFVFDSFTDQQNFFSPSSSSSATSPSQVLTPFTSTHTNASPITAPDFSLDVAGEVSLQDFTVPYLNPGATHGTNYVDFNLYSPGPEVFDEDPVLQMRDLGSRQQSPQSPGLDAGTGQHSPHITTTDAVVNDSVAASPVDLARYYDPGPTANQWLMTNHNRLVRDEADSRSPPGRQPTNRLRVGGGDSDSLERFATSSVKSPVSQHAPCKDTTSTVVANAEQSSVSPDRAPHSRRITSAPPGGPRSSPRGSQVSAKATQSGMLDSSVGFSLPTASVSCQSLVRATPTASSAVSDQSRRTVGTVAPAGTLRHIQSCASSSVARQLLAGRESGSSVRLDGQLAVQPDGVAVVVALATTLLSTLPTRRNVAGEEVKQFTFFFQLAVFGLVSVLCACALQALLASQVNLVNILAFTSISLARLAPQCPGPSSATRVASKPLPPPTPSGLVDNVKSKIQSVPGSLADLRSTASRWARSLAPRLPSVRTLRLS